MLGAISEVDVIAQRGLRALRSAPASPAQAPTGDAGAILNQTVARWMPDGVSGSIKCWGNKIGLSVTIQGEITVSFLDSLRKLFEQFHEQEKKIASGVVCDMTGPELRNYRPRITVNSVGGNIGAALAIGRLFRAERATLQVNGVCYSACVLMLAGAVDRRVGVPNQVGIHRPYFETAPQISLKTEEIKDAYLRVLEELRGYLRDMNVPQLLADDMLAVEPENNPLLTEAELKSYRLIGIDPAEQQARAATKEVGAIQEAIKLNINRQEYMRCCRIVRGRTTIAVKQQ